MKTVLIVEDEKMIRQGLKVMIQRSGVPVEVIMECSNGEMALEVIREQKVDVMFTDIRMPKMDGIELVEKMQDAKHVPITVAISGYDDFSYAVEMMRNGVREYLLKPIEREKITEILTKLNEEIESRKEQKRTNRKLGYQQMKNLMLLTNTTDEEMKMLEQQYESEFYDAAYVVCCQNTRKRTDILEENYIFLKEIEGNDLFVVEEEALWLLLKNELAGGFVGISGKHCGLRELRGAYLESLWMRKRAFCRNKPMAFWGEEDHIPEKLVEEAEKLLTQKAGLQRVQLLGTERAEDLKKVWQALFFEVKNGRLSEETFEMCIQDFFGNVEKTYRNVVGEHNADIAHFSEIWNKDCLDFYEDALTDWLEALRETICSQYSVNRNEQKIRQALSYIEENYARDLNMAVVSNYISMNYTLFSYSFKQYTGTNFVNFLKDIRMKEAKRLLSDTDLRIIEISQNVGYDNEKHFMKTFKAACGVSPSEYRKNARAK